ncbi:MAG TPA: outer membrane beta-barrel protein [Gammaproteobacteria bacterium]|nr:outer membrane beta-barrel protein [Gammaproteobacteria bacterium]
MLKKIIAIIIIFISSLSAAFAFRIYVKPTLSYLSTSLNNNNPSMVLAPGIAAGLGQVFYKYFYVGVETYWIPNTIPVNSKSNTYKISYQYAASLLPGIAFDNTILGYLRLGMLKSRFPSFDTTQSASQMGIGLEYSLSPTWSVNGEYDYVRYRSNTTSLVGSATTDQFTIGVLYKFNL